MRKTGLLFVLTMFCATSLHADALTGGKLLKLSKDQRNWWYSGAFMGIGHMVYYQDEEKALCVWNWLLVDPKNKQRLLRENLERYSEQSPTAIVIALLERDCGVLLPAAANHKE